MEPISPRDFSREQHVIKPKDRQASSRREDGLKTTLFRSGLTGISDLKSARRGADMISPRGDTSFLNRYPRKKSEDENKTLDKSQNQSEDLSENEILPFPKEEAEIPGKTIQNTGAQPGKITKSLAFQSLDLTKVGLNPMIVAHSETPRTLLTCGETNSTPAPQVMNTSTTNGASERNRVLKNKNDTENGPLFIRKEDGKHKNPFGKLLSPRGPITPREKEEDVTPLLSFRSHQIFSKISVPKGKKKQKTTEDYVKQFLKNLDKGRSTSVSVHVKTTEYDRWKKEFSDIINGSVQGNPLCAIGKKEDVPHTLLNRLKAFGVDLEMYCSDGTGQAQTGAIGLQQQFAKDLHRCALNTIFDKEILNNSAEKLLGRDLFFLHLNRFTTLCEKLSEKNGLSPEEKKRLFTRLQNLPNQTSTFPNANYFSKHLPISVTGTEGVEYQVTFSEKTQTIVLKIYVSKTFDKGDDYKEYALSAHGESLFEGKKNALKIKGASSLYTTEIAVPLSALTGEGALKPEDIQILDGRYTINVHV